MEEDIQIKDMNIFALKSAAGHILILGGCEGANAKFIMGSSSTATGILGFRLRANTASQIMLNVRALAKQFRKGNLVAEVMIPAQDMMSMPVMASFDLLTGNVENVSDDAKGAWSDLRRAANPVTFLTPTKDIQLIRSLTEEVMPGVLQTAAGEIAVKADEGWNVLDTLDPECVQDVLLPHLLSRRSTKDWSLVFEDLIGLVPPYIAESAVEAYDEEALDEIERPDEIAPQTYETPDSTVTSFVRTTPEKPYDPKAFPDGPDMR